MEEKTRMGKEELCIRLQENFQKVTGIDLSLKDTWNLFKTAVFTPYDISNLEDARISIPGIGVFTTSKILASYKMTGQIRPKFYGSSAIEAALTAGDSLIDKLVASIGTKKAAPKKAAVEEVEETTAAPKKAAPKKAVVEETKAAPKKAAVEEVEDMDDFDFDFI